MNADKSIIIENIAFWRPENYDDSNEFIIGYNYGIKDYLNNEQPEVFDERDSFPYKVGYCRGYVEEKLSHLKQRLMKCISGQSNAYDVVIAEQEYLQILDATKFSCS